MRCDICGIDYSSEYFSKDGLICNECFEKNIKEERIKETTNHNRIKEEMPVKTIKNISILNIIEDAICLSWEIKFSILRTLIIPYLIMTLLISIQPFIVDKIGSILGLIIGFLITIITSFIGALLVVSCHRLILLGESSVPKYGLIIPKMRELRFWGWTIALGFLIGVILGVLLLITTIIQFIPKIPASLIGFILGAYLFARFMLIFPAVALDLRPNPEWAWKQSKKNGWKLFILFVIPFIPASVIYVLLPFKESLLINGLYKILDFPFFVIGIVFISLSYKKLYMQDCLKD